MPSVPPGRDFWLYGLGAGGHDYGDSVGHPSTLAAVTINTLNEAWVREVRRKQTGDTNWIEQQRRELSQKYRISLSRWGFDPMQREAARLSGADVIISGQRRLRVGMIEARMGDPPKLFFDMSGPGVAAAYEQGIRIHWRKVMRPGQGEVFEYARIDDDDFASIENAIQVIDSKPPAPPRRATVRLPQWRPGVGAWRSV